ncbi:MAG: hypothetical protein FWG02_06010 [Holophagaceae bacterium]|nr:hypothetical protein [Holophagaceae bacterium]
MFSVQKHVQGLGIEPIRIAVDVLNFLHSGHLQSGARSLAYYWRKSKEHPPRGNFGRHVNGQPMARGNVYSLSNGHLARIA